MKKQKKLKPIFIGILTVLFLGVGSYFAYKQSLVNEIVARGHQSCMQMMDYVPISRQLLWGQQGKFCNCLMRKAMWNFSISELKDGLVGLSSDYAMSKAFYLGQKYTGYCYREAKGY